MTEYCANSEVISGKRGEVVAGTRIDLSSAEHSLCFKHLLFTRTEVHAEVIYF